MLSALCYDGTTTTMLYKGGTDIAAMETFVSAFLATIIKPGDIVVMDNLASHRNPAVVNMIEANGNRSLVSASLFPRHESHRDDVVQGKIVVAHVRGTVANGPA